MLPYLAAFPTARVIISQCFSNVNTFLQIFNIFLSLFKHFFDVAACKDVFFVTKTAIHL